MHSYARLKGDLHVHTAKEVCETHLGLLIEEYDEACGNIPLGEVVKAARDMAGMAFIGITNHSSDPVDPEPDRLETAERVHKQTEVIRKFCERNRGIAIYAGAEVNILPDGTLDVDDSVLDPLDYVIASMHFLEDLEANTIYENYLKIIESPRVKVIGHMNRHIHSLTDAQWESLVGAAAKHRTALEFNVAAQMTDELVAMVEEHAVLLTIGSDAHLEDSKRDFATHLIGPFMDPKYLGNALGRLANVPEARIVNFWKPAEVSEWLKTS